MIYSITEGQQAEEYKIRKAREERKALENDKQRAIQRDANDVGYKTQRYEIISGKPTNKNFAAGYDKKDKAKMDKDISNKDKALDLVEREIDRRTADTSGKVRKFERDEDGDFTGRAHRELMRAGDAALRHVRRHPEQYKESCGIFYTVAFI